MDILINAGIRSFRSLTTPGMAAILIKSLVITLISLAILISAMTYGIHFAIEAWSNWVYAKYLTWIAGFGIFLFAWLMFPAIMPLIISFFDESIIQNIEKHEYPNSLPTIHTSFLKDLPHDLKFALKTLFLNIVVIPLYLIPLVNLGVFLALNGYLLGNEFFLTVARRHIGIKQALILRKSNSQIIFLGGLGLVFLSTLPFINLIAPFWGVALMTHLYHAKTASSVEVR